MVLFNLAKMFVNRMILSSKTHRDGRANGSAATSTIRLAPYVLILPIILFQGMTFPCLTPPDKPLLTMT